MNVRVHKYFQGFVFRGQLSAHVSWTVFFLLLTVTIAACASQRLDVRQTSSLLEDLSVSTQEEEEEKWTAEVTMWSDLSGDRAWLRVEQLKKWQGSTRSFYSNSATNALPYTARNAGLPDGYGAYQVIEEGKTRNRIGELIFLRLRNDDRDCVYTLQYWGSTHGYERREEILGYTKIQSWYCAKAIDSEDFDAFVQGLIF